MLIWILVGRRRWSRWPGSRGRSSRRSGSSTWSATSPCPVCRRPLDGLRILHISDFHLGTVSLNGRALREGRRLGGREGARPRRRHRRPRQPPARRRRPRAASWRGSTRATGRTPCSGTTTSPPTRDPVQPSRRPERGRRRRAPGARVRRSSTPSGGTVQVVGGDPRRRAGAARAAGRSRTRTSASCSCTSPTRCGRSRPASSTSSSPGTSTAGRSASPRRTGKVRLEHLRAPYWEGVFELPQGVLHVSRGLGTSFVPFRFLARPEATILTLRSPE